MGVVGDTAAAPHIPWDPLSCFVWSSSGVCGFRWPALAAFCRYLPLCFWSRFACLCKSWRHPGVSALASRPLAKMQGHGMLCILPQVMRTKLQRVTVIPGVPCGIRQKFSPFGLCQDHTLSRGFSPFSVLDHFLTVGIM